MVFEREPAPIQWPRRTVFAFITPTQDHCLSARLRSNDLLGHLASANQSAQPHLLLYADGWQSYMRPKDLLLQLLPLFCWPSPKIESCPLQLGNQVIWARGPLLRPLLRTQGSRVLKQLHFLQPHKNASGPW